MKDFKELNYYEILEISSDASSFDIERAYRNARAMYNQNSLLTYTLFEDEERKRILQRIDDAYHTLINDSKRESYNEWLHNRPFSPHDSSKEGVAHYSNEERNGSDRSASLGLSSTGNPPTAGFSESVVAEGFSKASSTAKDKRTLYESPPGQTASQQPTSLRGWLRKLFSL